MALIYVVPFLLLLSQASANPLNSTEMTSTEIPFFGNDTSEPENVTDATVMPLTNLTSMNETVMEPFETTVEDISTDEATTTEDTEIIETMSYASEPEPEVTETNPPPTKKANIENLAVMAQAGTLAIVLPICIRLVTLWNSCL
ncbi:uncharacterized protein LOC129972966 [Argiope bruennichi]|uniref:Uncharacterized protein n=1 Tax=Argiope bruennichi TaxID=94029 RepID=A0A8T0FAR6_ARGBR|nr:uncharacterized protein LOC129972966 [Argiope bruennichi]XP_055943270.1 uncharacterized protein LOC129972966 [Argiope bruennichi]KAF8786460.1 hypothetical protein HNY73_008175 [Argiope bruennichi]